jgi:hypothetical protein
MTVAGITRTVDGNKLTVGDGTQTSDDQHQLGNTITSTSWSHHHQTKQHDHVCLHKAKI